MQRNSGTRKHWQARAWRYVTGLDALKGQCLGLFNELLGDVAVAQTQYSKALEYYQQALGFREQQLAGDDRAIALIQVKIGRTQAALHHDAEAETALKGAVGIFEKRTPPEREFGVALFELTRIYIAADRPEVVDTARRAVDVYTAVQGPNGPTIPIVKRYLGAALLTSADRQIKETKLGGAERSLREGIALFDPPLNGWETLYAKPLVELGTIYDLSGRYGKAEPYELRALEYRAKSAGPADPLLLQILAALAGHYDLNSKTQQLYKLCKPYHFGARPEQARKPDTRLGTALARASANKTKSLSGSRHNLRARIGRCRPPHQRG